MQYQYKARERTGQVKEGRLEAPDQAAALAQLAQTNLLVVSLTPVDSFQLKLNGEIRLGRQRTIASRDLSVFCGQFASLVGAGVPILEALTVLVRQFSKTPLGPILEAVIRSIESGNSLSQAMREHEAKLPASLLYITAVAEVSGNLDQSYALLATYFEQEDQFARKVKSAFTYPAVVLSVALVVILFMVVVVLPTYANLFSQMGAELPRSTQVLLAFGRGLIRFWYLVPLLVGGVAFGVARLMRMDRVKERWQRLVLRMPVWGPLTYKREMARLCRTLGTMTRSGVPLLAALATVQEALSFMPIKEALVQVQEEVRVGDTLGQALQRRPVFDRISVEIVTLGEAAGNLDAMLFRVADLAEKDVNSLLDRFTSLLEPALTVILGAIVVSIILPMILPMFDILGKVR